MRRFGTSPGVFAHNVAVHFVNTYAVSTKTKNMKIHEQVRFSLLQMPCCGILLCWVNPRLPSYCPECGKQVFIKMKNRQAILYQDDNAMLTHESVRKETSNV